MKSDRELYKLFKSIPEFFALLAPIDPNDEYTFSAPAVKDLVRHYDGYLEPKNPTASAYVIEFQAQGVPEIYPRIMGMEDAHRPLPADTGRSAEGGFRVVEESVVIGADLLRFRFGAWRKRARPWVPSLAGLGLRVAFRIRLGGAPLNKQNLHGGARLDHARIIFWGGGAWWIWISTMFALSFLPWLLGMSTSTTPGALRSWPM